MKCEDVKRRETSSAVWHKDFHDSSALDRRDSANGIYHKRQDGSAKTTSSGEEHSRMEDGSGRK
jgi:hypothetical protein